MPSKVSSAAQLSFEVTHENEGVTMGDPFKLALQLQVSIECVLGSTFPHPVVQQGQI